VPLELTKHTRRTAPSNGDVHQGRVPSNDPSRSLRRPVPGRTPLGRAFLRDESMASKYDRRVAAPKHKYKPTGDRLGQFPKWSEVLDVLLSLGYRKP